jgi:transcriptional regulator with XRE-family HTH domain
MLCGMIQKEVKMNEPETNLNPLLEARLNAGLSQEELATTAGVSRSAISNLESGKRTANKLTLGRLANALNLPISMLTSLATPEETLSKRGKKAITARYAKQQTVLTGELAG